MAISQKLQPLPRNTPIVDKNGYPSIAFQRWWQQVTGNSEFTQGEVEEKVSQGAVTAAELTMSADRLLGRTDGGIGAIEELTLSEALDLIGSAAHGDILYRDSATWARLAAGTSGHFLKTNGAGADPSWEAVAGGSAAWALAGTGQTATGIYDQAVDGSKANIDFTGLASFNEILVIARSLTAASSGVRALRVSVDNGSTFYATSGNYHGLDINGVESNEDAFAYHATSSTSARSFATHILNTKGAAKLCHVNSTSINHIFDASSSDINAIRIYNSGGGNITGGKVYVFAR